jgi:hypothetical protein
VYSYILVVAFVECRTKVRSGEKPIRFGVKSEGGGGDDRQRKQNNRSADRTSDI